MNLTDEDKKEIKLNDLVGEASRELMREKRLEASNLVKSFLLKAESLTYDIKGKKRELEKMEVSLADTLGKIEKLRSGDWSILAQNTKPTKADSVHYEVPAGE